MIKKNKPLKRDISGWLLLDKPVNITSRQAVNKVQYLFNAKKAGHGGTLDPLASGILPIALGEATKTAPYIIEGVKSYVFTVAWGQERTSDDSEGEIVKTSDLRPSSGQIEQIISAFTGEIWQEPPKFCALKINGKRAYQLSRAGKEPELAKRPVIIYKLDCVNCDSEDQTSFAISCSKGTYIRAIARDMGRQLGCFGYVSALRRLKIDGFWAQEDLNLITLEQLYHYEKDIKNGCYEQIDRLLLPTHSVLSHLISYEGDQSAYEKIKKGQKINIKELRPYNNINHNHSHREEHKAQAIDKELSCDGGKDDAINKRRSVFYQNKLLAIGEYNRPFFYPKRVFSL